MTPHQMLERIFGTLPEGGCVIHVEPPERSGRIPFTVYDPAKEEADGRSWVHRCGVSPAVLENLVFVQSPNPVGALDGVEPVPGVDYDPDDMGGFG